MLKFWDTYQQNYMYKRLENLLELSYFEDFWLNSDRHFYHKSYRIDRR